MDKEKVSGTSGLSGIPRAELQKFLNKGQKAFPYEMQRTMSSTIAKYLKGNDLKLAKKKYQAFTKLSSFLAQEFNQGKKGFLQMDHPISLSEIEYTKNFNGALRVNPIAGDVNKVKWTIRKKISRCS